MSNSNSLKPQIAQLTQTAVETTAKLRSRILEKDVTVLSSSMSSILPMAERLERLLRTTGVDAFGDVGKELDPAAVELWNITTMAMKCEPAKVKKILCAVKYFACLLLSLSETIDHNSLKLKFRSISCFVKALKSAMDGEDISLGQKIQEHADRKYQALEAIDKTFDKSTKNEFDRIRVELFVIKVQISIVEGDFEMAKLYEERSGLTNLQNIDSKLILESSRIIFNSCVSLYQNQDYDSVVYFLHKITPKLLSLTEDDTQPIKTSMLTILANSCLNINTSDSLKIAESTVQTLQEIAPTALDSFKMDIKLKRLKNSHSTDIENTIIQMLMSLSIVDNFKQVLAIINEHAISDPISAIKCYEFAITNKLDPGADHEALEMLFIAMVNAFIKDEVTPINIKQENLGRFVDVAEKIFIRSISKRTSSTCVTLLWTAGKREVKSNKYEEAIGWFRLTLHRMILINDDDKAKVQRALQNCYINTGNCQEALNSYEAMSDNGKKSLITQYNLFKIYLELNDETKLMEILRKISVSNNKMVIPLLSLCAVSTRANTRIAVEAMMQLFKNIDQQEDSGISVPKTLRCVIELIFKESGPTFKTKYTDTLVTLFTEARKFAKDTLTILNYRFTVDELKWFASQSFNISRSCLLSEDYLNGQLISEICIQFIDLIKDDISVKESLEMKVWSFKATLIDLMCTSKMKNVTSETLWANIRQKALSLRNTIDESKIVHQNRIEYHKVAQDWDQCLMDATLFQFQAELELSNWSASQAIVKETLRIKSVEFDSTMVNIVIDERFPEMGKAPVISFVIEKHIADNSIEGAVLSRWTRLLLETSLGSYDSETTCLKVLDKIMNRMRSQDSSERRLPAHEIEWLSTTCWNYGVSKMFNEDKLSGKNWCNAAIKLSAFVNERCEATLSKLWDEMSTSV